jgi:hypothetical protein
MHRRPLVLIAIPTSLLWLGGCSSDDSTASTKPAVTSAATTVASDAAAPTVCATADVGDRKVVTIDVDDESDGSGRFGLKTPSPLPAGSIRLLLNAVEGNADPVNVSVTSAGASVFDFVEVAPGVQCGADLDLAPGEYTVTFGAKTKTFTVDPAS